MSEPGASKEVVAETDLEQAIGEATEAVQVQAQQLDEITAAEGSGEPIGLGNLLEVPVQVTVQVGCSQLTLGELVKLTPGSLIPLDREANEPADVLVNGKIVARGEVVTIDDQYGVRITSVDQPG